MQNTQRKTRKESAKESRAVSFFPFCLNQDSQDYRIILIVLDSNLSAPLNQKPMEFIVLHHVIGNALKRKRRFGEESPKLR